MFGTFVAFFFDYDPLVSDIATTLITLPLLCIVINYIAPYVIKLKYESKTILFLFFLLPLAYYILEYTFTVYTNLLYTGDALVVDSRQLSSIPLLYTFYPHN